MLSMKLLRRSLVLSLAPLGLLACSSIGDGNAIESLTIVPVTVSGTTTVASAKVYRCVRNQVRAFGIFTDTSVGDYSDRVLWTSSDPNIVRVSNGDEPVPGQEGLVFAHGTLTGVTPGTATVTADFVGLHQEIQITVVDVTADDLKVVPASATLAPGSIAALRVTADLEGVVSDITSSAAWSFATPNDAVAKIESTTGVVTAVAAGGPLNAKASFTACEIAPTAEIKVKQIQSLSLQREFNPPPSELVKGTTEIFKVIATFDDLTTQDLSTQAKFTSEDTTVLSFSLLSGLTNQVVALAAGGPETLSASFAPEGFTAFPATPEVELSVVDATLNSINVVATGNANPSAPTIPALGTQQFDAIGNYSGNRTQEITRHVTWSSSDNAVVGISNISILAGLAVSLKNEAGSVTITATSARADPDPDLTATTTLTVSAPAP
jgi:hypothetical protein